MDSRLAVIDMEDLSVTPMFKIVPIEKIRKSEKAGHLVLETMEVVEVRIAGDKNYAPTFPVDAVWRRDGNQSITYAERWAEQYRTFKQGDPQEAMGTPLDMLKPYGVTPSNISLCKALKIYSIEALARLEDRGLKSLGMSANTLKEAAVKFLADRGGGVIERDRIAALEAEITALKAAGAAKVPEEQPAPEEIEAMVKEADSEFADMDDAAIKAEIEKLTGSKPKGNPSRATLENSLKELLAA